MPKRKRPHTACFKGKKVRVKLKSGEVIIDVFQERKGNSDVVLKQYGKLLQKDIVSFGILRNGIVIQKVKNESPT